MSFSYLQRDGVHHVSTSDTNSKQFLELIDELIISNTVCEICRIFLTVLTIDLICVLCRIRARIQIKKPVAIQQQAKRNPREVTNCLKSNNISLYNVSFCILNDKLLIFYLNKFFDCTFWHFYIFKIYQNIFEVIIFAHLWLSVRLLWWVKFVTAINRMIIDHNICSFYSGPEQNRQTKHWF